MIEKDKISQILDLLEEAYPEAECALHHQDVFQLIVAGTIRTDNRQICQSGDARAVRAVSDAAGAGRS